MDTYLEQVKTKRTTKQASENEANSHLEVIQSSKVGADRITSTLTKEGKLNRANIQSVKITNPQESVKTPDVEKVVQSVKELSKTIANNRPDDTELRKAVKDLKEAVLQIPKQIVIPKTEIKSVSVDNLHDYKDDLNAIKDTIENIEINPTVNVAPAKVEVPKIDVKPITEAISKLEQIVNIEQVAPVVNVDTEELSEGIKQVKRAINGLTFPVPNYILPFKDVNGKATQAQLDASGSVVVSGGKATGAYSISAVSDDGTYKYFWFEDADKNYYIMRKHKTNKVFTYTKGTGGYEAVYQSATQGPSGSPTFDSYGDTF